MSRTHLTPRSSGSFAAESSELNLEEAAQHMGRSRRSVYRYAQSGSLPARKYKGKWVFDKAALDTWLLGTLTPENTPEAGVVTTWWEEAYGPRFRAFLRGICDTNPGIIILPERNAERLAEYLGGVPEGFEGKILTVDQITFLEPEELAETRIVIVDDTVQGGGTLSKAAAKLRSMGAKQVETFAFVRCTDAHLDLSEHDQPIVPFLELGGAEFKRYFAGQTEFLESKGLPLDVDHAIIKLKLDVGQHENWLVGLWQFLGQYGNVFSVPSPAERAGVLEVTLDNPTFFKGVSLRRPRWSKLDGVVKIRFYIHLRTGVVYVVPIVTASLVAELFNTDDCTAVGPSREHCPFVSNAGDQSIEDMMLRCLKCTSLVLSSHLIEKFLKLLGDESERTGIRISSVEVDERSLRRMYGEPGAEIAASMQSALDLAVRDASPQQALPFPISSPMIHPEVTKRREVGGWLEALPLARLLVENRREVRDATTNDHVQPGLTVTEIRDQLKGSMTRVQVSRAMDLLLDLSVIVPIDRVSEQGVTRAYRAGEGSGGTAVFDPTLLSDDGGSGDGFAQDPIVNRFGRDMCRIAFILATAMESFGFRAGIAENIAQKLIGIVRLDCLNGDDTYISRGRERFGSCVQTYASYGGLHDKPTPLVGLKKYGLFTVDGPTDSRNYSLLRPADGWEAQFESMMASDTAEISAIEATVRVLGEAYRRFGRTWNHISDPLIVLASLRDEEMAYAHAYEDLSLWISDFHVVVNSLSAVGTTASPVLVDALRNADYSSAQVVWKVDHFEALSTLRDQLNELYSSPGQLRSTARNLASQLECTGLSARLSKLGRFGKLLTRLTALATALNGSGKKDLALLVERVNEGLTALELPQIEAEVAKKADVIAQLRRAYEAAVTYSRSNFDEPSTDTFEDMDNLELLELHAKLQDAIRERMMSEPVVVAIDGRNSTSVGVGVDDEIALAAAEEAFIKAIGRDLKEHDGTVLERHGDDALLIFDGVEHALMCSAEIIEIGKRLYGEKKLFWPIRIGMDKGEAVLAPGNVIGTPLNIASKLCSNAGDWQVAVSEEIVDSVVNAPCVFVDGPVVPIGKGLRLQSYVARPLEGASHVEPDE